LRTTVLLERLACRHFQLGRILEEFAYLKKKICHCGKHARGQCAMACTAGVRVVAMHRWRADAQASIGQLSYIGETASTISGRLYSRRI
jgi:hypothetical protein